MEKKLVRNPVLAEKCKNAIQENLDCGCAQKLTTNQVTNCTGITNYIPHLCVSSKCNLDKIRLVFDAGAKYNKTSLNEHLLKRPDLLNNFVSVLMPFHFGEFAVVGDMEQLFHQVKVRETDRDASRFAWKESPGQNISDFQMSPHLFGKINSPYCANYALKKSTIDNVDLNPAVIKTM